MTNKTQTGSWSEARIEKMEASIEKTLNEHEAQELIDRLVWKYGVLIKTARVIQKDVEQHLG